MTAIVTVVLMMLLRIAMMFTLCLVVRSTGGDNDHVPIGIGHRFEEPQRTAVRRRDELNFNGVPEVESIRAGWTDILPREARGGAHGHGPIDRCTILIFDRDCQRTVGIYKLDGFDGARQFLFRLHVIHAREGMMRL